MNSAGPSAVDRRAAHSRRQVESKGRVEVCCESSFSSAHICAVLCQNTPRCLARRFSRTLCCNRHSDAKAGPPVTPRLCAVCHRSFILTPSDFGCWAGFAPHLVREGALEAALHLAATRPTLPLQVTIGRRAIDASRGLGVLGLVDGVPCLTHCGELASSPLGRTVVPPAQAIGRNYVFSLELVFGTCSRRSTSGFWPNSATVAPSFARPSFRTSGPSLATPRSTSNLSLPELWVCQLWERCGSQPGEGRQGGGGAWDCPEIRRECRSESFAPTWALNARSWRNTVAPPAPIGREKSILRVPSRSAPPFFCFAQLREPRAPTPEPNAGRPSLLAVGRPGAPNPQIDVPPSFPRLTPRPFPSCSSAASTPRRASNALPAVRSSARARRCDGRPTACTQQRRHAGTTRRRPSRGARHKQRRPGRARERACVATCIPRGREQAPPSLSLSLRWQDHLRLLVVSQVLLRLGLGLAASDLLHRPPPPGGGIPESGPQGLECEKSSCLRLWFKRASTNGAAQQEAKTTASSGRNPSFRNPSEN